MKQQLRTAVIAAGKRIPFVHTAARATLTAWRDRSYRKLAVSVDVDSRTAVLESYSGRGYACSPRALYEAMLRDPAYDDYRLVWAFKPEIACALAMRGYVVQGLPGPCPDVTTAPEDDLELRLGASALAALERATIVVWDSPAYYRVYARAAYWISNARIPAHLKPRGGQSYIQSWHGTPLKRLGYDIPLETSSYATYSPADLRRHYGLEGERVTWLLSPSPFATEKFASAFNLNATGRTSVIVEEGYPRNDRLATFSADEVAQIRERLDLPVGKKVIVYAPTWRDDEHSSAKGYTLAPPVDFDALKERFADEYVVLFRAHYLVADDFDFERYGGFVRDVSAISDINDVHLIADVLVTDYSSVFFDFANLDKPMLFFLYDLAHYAEELRGFYLGIDELPGPVLRTSAELADAIAQLPAITAQTAEKRAAFRARFAPKDDGRASERVLARVMAARPEVG